jgi:complement component 1 Q subcomponent-binding protein
MLSRVAKISRAVAPRVISSQMQARVISSAAGTKLQKLVKTELSMEKEQYEQPDLIKKFTKSSPWKFTDSDGNVALKMTRDFGDKEIVLEWQLVSPFNNYDMEGQEGQEGEDMPAEQTDFTITIQDKSGEKGLMYYCQTAPGEGHRYVIGNVRSFSTAAERDCETSYNGPDFEDLEDSLQESFDEFLAEAGINDEVCDFIDATATDKEQREYMRWLNNVASFIQA